MHGLMVQSDWRKNRVAGGPSEPTETDPYRYAAISVRVLLMKLAEKADDDLDLGWSGWLLHG